MNERAKLILFLFLVSLSFYIARGIVVSTNFKAVPISPSRKYFPAPYGTIMGLDGEPLSSNSLSYNVYLDARYAKVLSEIKGWNYSNVVRGSLKYFGMNPDTKAISKILKRGVGGVEIGVVSKKKISNIPGKYRNFLNIKNVYVKSPPATPARILVSALQKEYQKYLEPKKSGEVVYGSFSPYKLYSSVEKVIDPVGGDTIFTTVDPRIQSFAFKAITQAVETNAASGGEVIVSNPQTGAIMAMASTWQWNAPIMNVFEPGSTLKPLVFAAALQDSVVSTYTTFNGPYFRPSPKVPLIIKDAENHPWPITLKQALVYSSDVAEMKIAHDYISTHGKTAFYDWFKKFGFGSKTGVDLPDEVRGLLIPPEKWYAIGGVEMSIGQGIAVTGIQLVSSLNSIANDGYLVKPHVVNKIISPEGTVLFKHTPQSKKIFNDDVVRIVKNFMIDVVKFGTGKPAQLENVLAGGKTGTAQKPVNGTLSRSGPYFSLFYGFFPADDPKYSILIMVDQPSKGRYYGQDVAAPVFHQVGEYILKLEGYDHQEGKRTFSPVSMPNLKGLTLNESLELLKSLSIPASEIDFSGNGVVIGQYPPTYTPLFDIKSVKISLGQSF